MNTHKNELKLPIQDERVKDDGIVICNICSESMPDASKYKLALVFTNRSGCYALIAHHDQCKPIKDYQYSYDANRSIVC